MGLQLGVQMGGGAVTGGGAVGVMRYCRSGVLLGVGLLWARMQLGEGVLQDGSPKISGSKGVGTFLDSSLYISCSVTAIKGQSPTKIKEINEGKALVSVNHHCPFLPTLWLKNSHHLQHPPP